MFLSKKKWNAYMRAYYAKPEVKAKIQARMRAYYAKPEVKAKISEKSKVYHFSLKAIKLEKSALIREAKLKKELELNPVLARKLELFQKLGESV